MDAASCRHQCAFARWTRAANRHGSLASSATERTMRRVAARSQYAGFTLIEALLATLLMAMIMGALAQVTSQWLRNWNRGFARIQSEDLLAVGLDRLVADLAAAEIVAGNATTMPMFDG